MATMNCDGARPLVPSYLDGELTEAQAGPLRKHLLACQPCRASAQAGKNLKRWFAPTEPIAVPRDFAARVTRMAFAGVEIPDATPAREPELVRAPVAPALVARVEAEGEPADGRILVFVLRLTAAAAVVALLSAIAIQSLRRPTSSDLRADDRRTMTLDQALERLDRLERAEAGRDATTGVPAADGAR